MTDKDLRILWNLLIFVWGTVVFTTLLHAWTFLTGAVDDGVMMQWRLLGTAEAISIFIAIYRGAGIGDWLCFMVPLAVAAGLNVLSVHYLLWALVLGTVYLALTTGLFWMLYMETPFPSQNGPIGVKTPRGILIINTAGRTRREVYAAMRRARKRR